MDNTTNDVVALENKISTGNKRSGQNIKESKSSKIKNDQPAVKKKLSKVKSKIKANPNDLFDVPVDTFQFEKVLQGQIESLDISTVTVPKVKKTVTLDCDIKAQMYQKYGRARARKPITTTSKDKKKDLQKNASDIAFIIPKFVDPDVQQMKRSQRLIQKLINYLKRSWRVKINRNSTMTDLAYRTLEKIYHVKPENWWLLKRARQKVAECTGYFSSVRGPYADLGPPELDTALLVLHNLPSDLKIHATRWLRDKYAREEAKIKRDAYLPKLPRVKVRRPKYASGACKPDAAGMQVVEDFVKVGENFQRGIRGSTTYTTLLNKWSQKREHEAANQASAFGFVYKAPVLGQGTVSEDTDKNKQEKTQVQEAKPAVSTDSNASDEPPKELASYEKSIAMSNDRAFQRAMLDFEQMMKAIYIIIRSLLNMRKVHLTSHLPMHEQAVKAIRNRSPGRKDSTKNKPPISKLKEIKRIPAHIKAKTKLTDTPFALLEAEKKKNNNSSKSRPGSGGTEDTLATDKENVNDLPKKEESILITKIAEDIPDLAAAASLFEMSHSDTSENEEHEHHPHHFHLHLTDHKAMLLPQTSVMMVQAIKAVHSLNEDIDAKEGLAPEKKLKTIQESPFVAQQRTARHVATYAKLFERNKPRKKPIWHHVRLSAAQEEKKANSRPNSNQSGGGRDTNNLPSGDVLSKLAMIRRSKMQNTKNKGQQSKKIPNEADIPTPIFSVAQDAKRLSSAEQSKLNLMHGVPSDIFNLPPTTPIRHLFRLAGVKTTERDIFYLLMELKTRFRQTQKRLKVYSENDCEKFEWDTLKRFNCKMAALTVDPIFEWTMELLKKSLKYDPTDLTQKETSLDKQLNQPRASLWYRKLVQKAEEVGAFRHHGCQNMLMKIQRYSDVDTKSREHMLSRLCLLVISLPVTEIGTVAWQDAILFLLEHFLGAPRSLFYQWMNYIGLPAFV